MPLPKPKAGEKRQDYIDRMMGDKRMMAEYPNQGQRYAVARNAFDRPAERQKSTCDIAGDENELQSNDNTAAPMDYKKTPSSTN